MAKGKSGKRVLCAPRMASERASPTKLHKRWGEAFGKSALSALGEAHEIAKILEGHYHPKRHSDGATPWQFVLGDYCVRFSKKGRGDLGTWGIYLRAYNVRLATFSDNSAHMREALAKMFDAAHALAESWKAVEKKIKG